VDLHSGAPESDNQAPDLSVQAPPSTTLPPGPRRIHDRRRGWRRLRRVGLAALAGLGGGLATAWGLATDALPPLLRIPQPLAALPAQDLLVPMLLVALGLVALWRLSAWVLPLVMAGLLLGGVLSLLARSPADPGAALDLLISAPMLTALALPLLAIVLNRTLMRRLRLTGRLTGRREVLLFSLLGGLAAPALAGLFTLAALVAARLTLGGAVSGALELAAAWGMALLSTGTALQASTQRPRRGGRWAARVLATTAVIAQAGLIWLPQAGAALLLPHLLLCLHALQASPRANALLGAGLLGLWALTAPPTLAFHALGAGFALLPLILIALSHHQLRDRDGWRSALDAQGLALAEWRLPEGRRHASARWQALTTPVDGTVAGSAPLDWVGLAHPRDREPVRRALRELLVDPQLNQLGVSLRLAADGGDWRWHELQAHVPLRDRRGRARGLIATLADVSWRHTAEERERMSATLFQQASEGLAVVDMQWRVVEVNPAYCDILHASREALVGRPAAPLSTANLQRSGHESAEVQDALNAGLPWSGQLQAELEDGGRHVFATKLSPVPEPEGVSPRWRLLSLTDLGESLRQQDLLRRSPALRCCHRPSQPRRVHAAAAAGPGGGQPDGFRLVIGLIDLDEFARVNAEHGQLVADAVLLQLSARLQATLRGSRGAAPDTADQLARLHGDEFAVLMRVQTPEEAQRASDRLLAVLSTPVAIRENRVGNGLAIEIGASMGATVYPQDDADPETLLRHAGHALYRAKHAGRGGIQFHDPTLDQRDEAGMIAVARLQRALDSNELLLHYQPQIDLRNGQIMGVEALLRDSTQDLCASRIDIQTCFPASTSSRSVGRHVELKKGRHQPQGPVPLPWREVAQLHRQRHPPDLPLLRLRRAWQRHRLPDGTQGMGFIDAVQGPGPAGGHAVPEDDRSPQERERRRAQSSARPR
jgi:diguanylate cyclase (GGDEF)-like protein